MNYASCHFWGKISLCHVWTFEPDDLQKWAIYEKWQEILIKVKHDTPH